MIFNQHNIEAESKNKKLEIYTLGRFQVRCGDQTLFAESGRSQKIGELFMYLISHREKPTSPEVILEALWPEQEYSNPKNAIKIMIHRLKQKMETKGVPQARDAINCSYGCYGWNNDLPYWLDAEAFEVLSQEAKALAETDPLLAADKYRKALALYRGDYLPECLYSDWVLPVRHYYRSLFVRSVSDLLTLQKEHRLFSQMLEDCEKALFIDRFDEGLHLRYLEALLAKGKTSRARAHYEHITSLIYQELGVKPSQPMRQIYRDIKTQEEKPELDFNDLKEMIKERDKTQSAMLCDPQTFRFLCNLEKRRAEREDHPVHLGLLTLTSPDFQLPASSKLQQSMEQLQQILLASLRRGDVVTPWNDSQFTLLLPGLNREQAESVLQRVRGNFNHKCSIQEIVLRSSTHPVFPWE